VYVVLYGTGIRHATSLANVTASVGGRSIPVQYAGEAPGYPGLDQINIGPLPSNFQGGGQMDVFVTVGGQQSNTVTLSFK